MGLKVADCCSWSEDVIARSPSRRKIGDQGRGLLLSWLWEASFIEKTRPTNLCFHGRPATPRQFPGDSPFEQISSHASPFRRTPSSGPVAILRPASAVHPRRLRVLPVREQPYLAAVQQRVPNQPTFTPLLLSAASAVSLQRTRRRSHRREPPSPRSPVLQPSNNPYRRQQPRTLNRARDPPLLQLYESSHRPKIAISAAESKLAVGRLKPVKSDASDPELKGISEIGKFCKKI
ncbi:nuclear factor Y [Striga asiatica]|uniref:Nuclear factor Y n=1 Tax=Striga asiatica TaxID=4170 RepID=A0A5A7QQ37_STRAF|nr:nuclear factor Y [Striga asiatica]